MSRSRLSAVLRFHTLALALVISCGVISPAQGSQPAAQPVDQSIKEVVARHFRNNQNYRPGDLICRTDVEPIFNELQTLGISSSSGVEDLYDSFLLENDPLVKTLRTVQGQEFMRKVSAIPGVYERLERLSWIPQGRDLLNQLVVQPDGPQVLQSLLTPEGLVKLQQQLGDDPRGRNLRLPTGHILTEAQLLDRLLKAHAPRRTN